MSGVAPGGVDPVLITAAATIAATIITATVTILTVKVQHRGKPENALIDQLQEQLDRADARSDKQDSRMEKIEGELGKFKKREKIRDDYIVKLREHINAGSPPPPPPWPEGLYD